MQGAFLRAQDIPITFVPPPMEGRISMGVFSSDGNLVRVLHRAREMKEFKVALNGLVTAWDGRDDSGVMLPAGSYRVRGILIGGNVRALLRETDNDWADGDVSRRVVRIPRVFPREDGGVRALCEIAGGSARILELGPDGGLISEQDAPGPPAEDSVARVRDGGVFLGTGEDQFDKPFVSDAMEWASDVSPGRNGTFWVADVGPGSPGLKQFSGSGEFLRHLMPQDSDPWPVRVAAAAGDESVWVVEENAGLRRLRLLRLDVAPPGEEGASTWNLISQRDIHPAIASSSGTVAEARVRLLGNPLESGQPRSMLLRLKIHGGKCVLETGDGLPLQELAPACPGARLGLEQSEGTAWTARLADEAGLMVFDIATLSDIARIDAGDFQWNGSREEK